MKLIMGCILLTMFYMAVDSINVRLKYKPCTPLGQVTFIGTGLQSLCTFKGMKFRLR